MLNKALCEALVRPTVGPVAELKDHLQSLQSNTTIQWIPGHANIPGNELADKAAKEATLLNDPPAKISFESIKNYIKRSIVDPPIKHTRTAEVYKDFSNKTDSVITSRSDQTLLARLRSGHHLSFRDYQHRLDENASKFCPDCPGEIHDLSHWMTRCAATSEIRQRLFGTTGLTLNHLSTHPAEMVQMARQTLA